MKRLYLLLALSLATGYSCAKNGDDNDNTPEYLRYAGHSYLIVKELKTWTDAAADAVARGGYLVEIGDKSEQDAIYQWIRNSGISTSYTAVPDGGGIAYIWIGATDRASEGEWVWNGRNQSGASRMFWSGDKTGTAVDGSYYNWGGTAAGKCKEPDNYIHSQYSPSGQNAAAIGLVNWPPDSNLQPFGVAGQWNDIAETNKIYYIVEFDTGV